MKRTKNILLLIVTYLILSQPFLFSYIYLPIGVSYTIKLLILLCLWMYSTNSYSKSANYAFFVVLGLLYVFISFLNHPERIVSLLLAVIDVTFYAIVVKIFKNSEYIRSGTLSFIHKLGLFVSVGIILAHFIYQYVPGIFSYSEDIAGYHGYINVILGIINDDKMRPCWYFAEPSYSGFFLGFCFLLSLNKQYSSKKKKVANCMILLMGVIFTGSTGTYVYLCASLLVWGLTKVNIKPALIEAALYGAIFATLVVLPKVEEYGYLSIAVQRSEASFLSRQNRLNIAKEVANDMTITDMLVGKGPEYVTVKYQEGLSDAYSKMYCEFGIVFLFFFLLHVRKIVKSNLPILTFSMLSYLSVIIFITPLVLLCYQCANLGVNDETTIQKKQISN